MRNPVPLIIFLFAFVSFAEPVSSHSEAREQWSAGYEFMQSALLARDQGDGDQALALLRKAQGAFDEVQTRHPKWNEAMIEYRLRFCAEQIEALKAQKRAPRPADSSTAELLAKRNRELTASAQTIRAMKKEVTRLSKSLDQARRESARTAQEAQRYTELAAENDRLRERNTELKSRASELAVQSDQQTDKQGLDSLRLELSSAREQLTIAREKHKTESAKSQAQLADLSRKNRHLSIDLEAAKEAMTRRTETTVGATELIEQMQLKLDDTQAARRRAESTVKVDQQRITTLQRHVDVLQAIVDESGARMEEQLATAAGVRDQTQKIQAMALTLKGRDREIALLNATNLRLAADLAARLKEVQEMGEHLTALRDPKETSPEAAVLRLKLQDLYADLQRETQLRKAAEFAKSRVMIEIGRLEKAIAQLETSVAASRPGEEISIDGSVVPLPPAAIELRTQQAELDRQAAELRAQIADLMADIGALSPAEKAKRLPALRAELTQLTEAMDALSQRQETLNVHARQNVSAVVERVQGEQSKALAVARAQITERDVRVRELQKLLRGREADLVAAAKSAETLRQRLAQTTAQNVRLRGELGKNAAQALSGITPTAPERDELQSLRQAYQAARDRELAHQSTIDGLLADLAEQERLQLELKQKLSTQHSAVTSQMAGLRKDAVETTQLRAELNQRNQDIDQLQRANAELRSVSDQLERRFAARVAELHKEESDLFANRDRLKTLTGENAALRQKYETQVALTRAISAQLAKQSGPRAGVASAAAASDEPADLPGYRQLVSTLKRNLAQAQSELQTAQAATLNRGEAADSLARELAELRGELTKTESKSDYRQTLLQKQIAKLLSELDAERSRNEDLSAQASVVTATAPKATESAADLDRAAHVQAQLNQAAAAEAQGKTEAAKWHYQSILEEAPDNLQALRRLGHLLVEFGDLENGQAYLSRAYYLNPDAEETLLPLGYALAKLGKSQMAVSMLSRAAALFPDNPDTHRALGVACRQLGWSQTAAVSLERSFELDGNSSDTAFNLAVLYTTLEKPRFDKARFWYQAARRLGAEPDPALERVLAANQ